MLFWNGHESFFKFLMGHQFPTREVNKRDKYRTTTSTMTKILLTLISNTEAVAQRCSLKKGVLNNFIKFTGKYLCQSLFFNKVAGLRPTTLLKKRLWHRCFLVNFAKFLRRSFLQNTSGRLLTNIRFWPYSSIITTANKLTTRSVDLRCYLL